MEPVTSRSGAVTVEEVTGGKGRVRFTELPHALHGNDPRWAPPITAWERYRLDRHRNPYFTWGDAAYFLARRRGRPCGRVAAHVAEPEGVGAFGFWSLADDPEVASALLEATRTWLDERGCRTMRGPSSFTDDDEPGVLVAGHHIAGLTGRPWNPPWEAGLLEEAGGVAVDETLTWRLATTAEGSLPARTDQRPGQAGSYLDPRLVLDGIAAVPDVAASLRTTGLRSAWGLARKARTASWDEAVVVRCDGDPRICVPGLLGVAGRAGYRSVVAPWSPDPSAPPETVHRRYRFAW
jgi:hypothetical protein